MPIEHPELTNDDSKNTPFPFEKKKRRENENENENEISSKTGTRCTRLRLRSLRLRPQCESRVVVRRSSFVVRQRRRPSIRDDVDDVDASHRVFIDRIVVVKRTVVVTIIITHSCGALFR